MVKNEFFIAIDIGGTNIKSAIFDKKINLIFKENISTSLFINSDKILKEINLIISNYIEKALKINGFIKGIGIVLPGHPDIEGRVSFIQNVKQLNNIPIKKYLMNRKEIPIIFENDGNASAYAEYILSNKKLKNIIVLTLGTGLGSGVIVDGKILYGKKGISGELGHITLDSKGPRCICGKRGCFEAYFSSYGICELAKNLITDKYSVLRKYSLNKINPEIIANEAKNGDKLSKYIYKYTGKYLGLGISILINIFNPEKVILAGKISKDIDLFRETMVEEVKKNIFLEYIDNINIEVSKYPDDLGLFGAVSLFY